MIVRKLEALFTINTNAAQFRKATSQLDGLAGKAETVMKTIAGYWAVQALQNFVTNTAKAMAEVGKTAEYLGITAEALQELHYAAEKSGVSIDALNDAIKEIQVRATDAKSGQGEAAEAFKMLGLSSTDAAGRIREPLELLDAVADRLKALPSHSERIWIADAIFGDEGSTVIKMLKGGSQGLKQMRFEARALGGVLRGESTESAARLTRAFKRLEFASHNTGRSFVSDFFKPLSWLTEKLSDLVVSINRVEVPLSIFQVALMSLSATLGMVAIKAAIAFAPMLIAAAPAIAGVSVLLAGLLALVVVAQDLWVAFNGGDSIFGTLWQKSNEFFAPFEKKLLKLPQKIADASNSAWHAVTRGVNEAWVSAQREFSGLSIWISNASDAASKGLKAIWALASVTKERISDFFSTIPDAIKQSLTNGLKFVEEKFVAFQEWLTGAADRIKERFANLFDGLMPDFVKKGVVATIKHVSSPTAHQSESQNLNARLAPTSSQILHQNRVSSNQSVSVSVNVKSGVAPQDIGGEVAKAIRKELERERFNAFMGVSQYVG